MKKLKRQQMNDRGFTMVELLLATIIFPIIVVGIVNAFQAVSRSYTLAKQYNEMYAVLSACPEIDRALDYTILTGSTNCSPNNVFTAEGGGSRTFTYSPSLSVTDTSALSSTDPLKSIPDSKVLSISVGFQKSTAAPLQLRMLITRNGVGQL